MTNTLQVTMRMDSELVAESREFLRSCGLTFNQGVQMLLRKMLNEGRIIVEPGYNAATLAAFAEADEITAHPERYSAYSCAEELHRSIVAEDE